ncbi:MAG: primosomal protein N' [Oscillospiraceae bacterium]|nr:primosomal protein N' [Oscillospiraceae bacterium]
MKFQQYVAAVAVESAAYAFDKAFHYLLPSELYRQHLEGCRVVVPFGRGNQKRVGIVLSVSETDGEDCKGLKKILSIADTAPILNEEQLLLMHWLKENTFCSYYDAIRAMLPAALQLRVQERYELVQNADTDGLSQEEQQFLQYLYRARNRKELDMLLDVQESPQKKRIVDSLTAAGIIRMAADAGERMKGKTVRMVRLSERFTEGNLCCSFTVKQQQVVNALQEYGSLEEKEVCYLCGVTAAVVQRLEKNGAVIRYDVPAEDEDIPCSVQHSPQEIKLSEQQQAVFDQVAPHLETQEPQCFLLHGVTGSGKTSVFEALIARTLSLGKTVLMLLPEIGLTPQTVKRFSARFGDRIAVMHSSLSLGERKRSYERVRSGRADLVIGTRSAVFAPLQNIGLIIMDEEGERSYKSDAAPRFDTIQVARYRCRIHGAVLLPASATPTLESYYFAQKDVYHLLEMTQRYGDAPLPSVEVADMNEERMQGNDTEFSTILTQALEENLKRGEQSILLLNRRGYHTIISCCTCNQPVYCKNCSVPMTYHKSDGNLHCHYCGSIQRMPEQCPTCHGEHLRKMGFGTQRLEDELAARFPQARILRMDADTTTSRFAYEKSFEAFKNGEYDIMLGTQMIGKGLDFPNVTLVGVMSVDKALFSGDFRSYERTFALITQVVGRGGRGGKPGRAILQTFLPDHYVLRLAAQQDYHGFVREELAIRKQLLFPPFCDVCVIGVTGESEAEVQTGAEKFVACMKEELTVQKESFPLRVLGPVPCTYGKINGKYRYRIIIKCKNTQQFRNFMRDVLKNAGSVRETARVHIYADMNGSIGI